MSHTRNIKPLKIRAWFKAKRGGTKVSVKKDFPMRRDGDWGRGNRQRKTEGHGGEECADQRDREKRHMVVETPVFIPYSKESAIKRRL